MHVSRLELGCFLVAASLSTLRAATFMVNTVADELDVPSGSALSLREALRDAAASPGPDVIVFARALDGRTLKPALSTEFSAFVLEDKGGITLDASSLPQGLTLDGKSLSIRLFYVRPGADLTLRGIKVTQWGGPGFSQSGGAFYNGGTLNLVDCTLSENSTSPGSGGAILNFATANLKGCALVRNTAVGWMGGAVANFAGRMVLDRCTFWANSSVGSQDLAGGGGVANSATMLVQHCTFSGNYSSAGYLGGGAIWNSGTMSLVYSILSANGAASGAGMDLLNTGVIDFGAPNLAGGVLHTSAAWATGINPITQSPLLAPLDNYGGPTPTQALRPGSPAIDAAVGSPNTTDQRGFDIHGTPDIGAYESGTQNVFSAWIWERLPADAPVEQHAADADFDQDGRSNGDEFATGTNPAVANTPPPGLVATLSSAVGDGSLQLSFTATTGSSYRLWFADDLTVGSWQPADQATIVGDGSSKTFSILPGAGPAHRFYRVQEAP